MCCSYNCFPKFLKFWTLLFILSCLGVCGFMNSFFFPFSTVWIVLRSTVFMLFEKLLCLQMVWVMEFKVQFENVVLWSEWFLSVLSKVHFCSNQSFSSLCSRGVGEETNYFYRCTAEVFRNLTFFFIWFFGGQLNMNCGHSSLCSRRCGS